MVEAGIGATVSIVAGWTGAGVSIVGCVAGVVATVCESSDLNPNSPNDNNKAATNTTPISFRTEPRLDDRCCGGSGVAQGNNVAVAGRISCCTVNSSSSIIADASRLPCGGLLPLAGFGSPPSG